MGHESYDAPSGQGMYDNEYSVSGKQPISAIPEYHTKGGIADLNLDWTGKGETGRAGACWDVAQLEPCCGEPCNFAQGLYCCLCFTCCGLCSCSKMLSYSLDQQCAVVNHCLPIFCLAFVVSIVVTVINAGLAAISPSLGSLGSLLSILNTLFPTVIRNNLRAKWNIGGRGSWLGDWFMVCCCFTAPCQGCQEVRGMPVSGWDWLEDVKSKGIVWYDGNTCGKFVRD